MPQGHCPRVFGRDRVAEFSRNTEIADVRDTRKIGRAWVGLVQEAEQFDRVVLAPTGSQISPPEWWPRLAGHAGPGHPPGSKSPFARFLPENNC